MATTLTTTLIIGKWLLAWTSAHDLTLAWLFSAILSQMPAKDPETMPFAKQWSYQVAQLLAANLNHLTQKKG
jgi:hypothetical protein